MAFSIAAFPAAAPVVVAALAGVVVQNYVVHHMRFLIHDSNRTDPPSRLEIVRGPISLGSLHRPGYEGVLAALGRDELEIVAPAAVAPESAVALAAAAPDVVAPDSVVVLAVAVPDVVAPAAVGPDNVVALVAVAPDVVAPDNAVVLAAAALAVVAPAAGRVNLAREELLIRAHKFVQEKHGRYDGKPTRVLFDKRSNPKTSPAPTR